MDAPTAVPAPSVPYYYPAPPPAWSVVRFLGNERDYWRLLIRGSVLLMFTLGIYRFWLTTDMRRFLWGNTEIAGETLEYTGTARELLIGFLIAMAVMVPLNVAFFAAALGLGLIGQFISVLVFVVLTLLGQYAVFRARRYRLTRSVYRGIRFLQSGSAIRYAIYAMLWWTLTSLTLGLAYPWAQASLERYKMRHTAYGTLGGRFVGSGTRLFFRGILLWLLVIGPFFAGIVAAIGAVDWKVLIDVASQGGEDVLARLEGANPSFWAVLTYLILSLVWITLAAAVLYPAFQAITLRWWTSGIRFGDLAVTSRLRTGQVYGVYVRFVGYSLLFGLVAGAVAATVAGVLTAPFPGLKGPIGNETVGIAVGLVGYVIIMLGYSAIYQVVVKLRLWRLAFEMVDVAGLHALDNVQAAGAPSSSFGEGLADALNVGEL